MVNTRPGTLLPGVSDRKNLVDDGCGRIVKELLFQCLHGKAQGRVCKFRGQFGQGRQDKHPLVHPGMGHLQERSLDNALIIEQKIKIKKAVLVADSKRITAAAEFPFNPQQQGQQLGGRQAGPQLAHRVDKPVFRFHVNRSAAIAGGQPLQLDGRIPSEPLPGLIQDLQGIAQIGTKTYPGGGEVFFVQGNEMLRGRIGIR